jgi:acyl dehydratase
MSSMPGLTGLYVRALRGRLPIVGKRSEPGGERLTLRVDGLRVDRRHLDAYRQVCGFVRSDLLPATYLQAVAFPLILALLTDSSFPFPAMGMVHLGNRIVTRGPLGVADPLELSATVGEMANHPRGRRVTIEMAARARDTLVWSAEMDLLHREPHADASRTPGSRDLDVPDEPPRGPQVWRLSSDLGRRYAAVSGDRNPIHLTDLTARPLGFRRHIAHGMWTHARAMAEITHRLPDAYWVDVTFTKPVILPGSVRFGARDTRDAIDFGVVSMAGDTHLLGRVHRPETAIAATG